MIGGYAGIGVVWAVLRWSFWVGDLMYYHRVRIQSFKTVNKVTVIAPGSDLEAKLFQNLSDNTPMRWGGKVPPDVYDNKTRICFWIGYWPFSAAWTLIHNPFERIGRFLYNRITGLLRWVTTQIVQRSIKSF